MCITNCACGIDRKQGLPSVGLLANLHWFRPPQRGWSEAPQCPHSTSARFTSFDAVAVFLLQYILGLVICWALGWQAWAKDIAFRTLVTAGFRIEQ
jgi:hypothetical protein